MQFIYLGEARFYEERMSEFLKVSKDLEIKDLSTGIEMNNQTASNSSFESDEQDNKVVDEDVAQTFFEDGANVEHLTQTATRPIIRNNEANKKLNRIDGAKYPCHKCDKQYTQQNNLTKHIQSAHEGVKYDCNQCDYQATQQGILTKHIQSKHEGVKYAVRR